MIGQSKQEKQIYTFVFSSDLFEIKKKSRSFAEPKLKAVGLKAYHKGGL